MCPGFIVQIDLVAPVCTPTALAVADLVTCLLIFFSGIAKGAAAESYWWQLFDVYMHLGFGSVSTTISIAVIVMVTIERLILIR